MLTYKTNLGEKLFGYALSKEFVKRNTPFCDLVDDPDVGVDIDLAVNFNKAINGNSRAAEEFTNTLVLSSGIIDPGTVEFWLDKINNYPVFNGEIERINYTFGNLGDYDIRGNSFGSKLKRALTDCLNSPCNLFSPMSNSIGSITNTTPLYNNASIFPVGDLKDSLRNVTAGVHDTIFKKIPDIFQEGIAEIAQLTTNTWGDFLQTITFKDNPQELINKALGGSMRTLPAGYLYTPDLSNLFSMRQIASNVLGGISRDLGGCFNRFEYASEYNPYSSNYNKAVASTILTHSYNGESYGTNANYQPTGGVKQPNSLLSETTGNYGRLSPYNDGEDLISNSIILQSENSQNRNYRYTMFAAWLDEDKKTIWVDNQNESKDDAYTISGISNIGKVLTPSKCGVNDPKELEKILSNGPSSSNNSEGYGQLYSQGVRTNEYLTKIVNRFNHGVAINEELLVEMFGRSFTANTLARLQRQGRIFVACTYNNKTELVQVIDRIGPERSRSIDFTPYAFFKLTGRRPNETDAGVIKFGEEWKQITYKYHPSVGEISCRIVIADAITAKELLNTPDNVRGFGNGIITYRDNNVGRIDDVFFGQLQRASQEAGVDLIITSGFRTSGSGRHRTRKAADFRILSGRKQLTAKDAQSNASVRNILINFVRAAKRQGITSFGMDVGYMTSVGGVMHADNAPGFGQTIWGRTMRRPSAPSWLITAYSG
jgi:hypothetical protein